MIKRSICIPFSVCKLKLSKRMIHEIVVYEKTTLGGNKTLNFQKLDSLTFENLNFQKIFTKIWQNGPLAKKWSQMEIAFAL